MIQSTEEITPQQIRAASRIEEQMAQYHSLGDHDLRPALRDMWMDQESEMPFEEFYSRSIGG